MARRHLWLLLALSVAINLAAGIAIVAASVPHFGDFGRYHDIASTPGTPYRDFGVEYPILTYGVLRAVYLLAPASMAFAAVLVALNIVLELVVAFLLQRAFGRRASAVWLMGTIAMAHVLVGRNDLLSIAPAVLALWAWQRGLWGRAGLGVTVAAFFKLWPAALAIIFIPAGAAGPSTRWRYWTGLLLSGAALLAWWLSLAGVDGVVQTVTYRGATGWQIESLPGAVARFFLHGAPRFENGAHRIGDFPGWTGSLFTASGLVIACTASVRARRTGQIGLGWVASVGAIMVCSTLLSMQFVAWLIPGAALIWARDEMRPGSRAHPGHSTAAARWAFILVSVCVALVPVLDSSYVQLVNGALYAEVLTLLRNLALAAAVLCALRALFARASMAGHSA